MALRMTKNYKTLFIADTHSNYKVKIEFKEMKAFLLHHGEDVSDFDTPKWELISTFKVKVDMYEHIVILANGDEYDYTIAAIMRYESIQKIDEAYKRFINLEVNAILLDKENV